MSFSAARPIVMAPGVPAAADERGESNFTKRVARFDTSAVLASTTVSSVGGVKPGWGGAPACTTVRWSGGVPRCGMPDAGTGLFAGAGGA